MNDFAKLSVNLKDVHILNFPKDYQKWYKTFMDHFILKNLKNVTYKPQEHSTNTPENTNKIKKYNQNYEITQMCIKSIICYTT